MILFIKVIHQTEYRDYTNGHRPVPRISRSVGCAGVSMCTSGLRVVVARAARTYEGAGRTLFCRCILQNGFCEEIVAIEGQAEVLNWRSWRSGQKENV